MSKLSRFIKERGVRKEHIIKATKINRNKFYIGLKYPNVFDAAELKAIASALKTSVKNIIN